MRRHQLAAFGAVLLLPLTLLFSQPGCADDGPTGTDFTCALPEGTYPLPRGGDLVSMTLTSALEWGMEDTAGEVLSADVEVQKSDGTTQVMTLYFVVSIDDTGVTGTARVHRTLDEAKDQSGTSLDNMARLELRCDRDNTSGSVSVS